MRPELPAHTAEGSTFVPGTVTVIPHIGANPDFRMSPTGTCLYVYIVKHFTVVSPPSLSLFCYSEGNILIFETYVCDSLCHYIDF